MFSVGRKTAVLAARQVVGQTSKVSVSVATSATSSTSSTRNVLPYVSEAVRRTFSMAAAAAVSASTPTSNPDSPTIPHDILGELRMKHKRDIDRLVEVTKANHFTQWLQQQQQPITLDVEQLARVQESGLTSVQLRNLFEAAVMTFLVHVESRSASSVGQGFYTIGPCGEEMMGAIALASRPTDSIALHYRHVATQITRQLTAGRSIEDILLDRARGHTVSVADPVTGGVHCAIGGGEYDFLVTSTLASQACPAVGRALATGLSHYISSAPTATDMKPHFPQDAVSIVSVGDGSANNGHFLSAMNLAEYSAFRKYKCPTVFIVTDNDIAISLRGHGWIGKKWIKKIGMPVYEARGDDALDIYTATQDAIKYARSRGAPAFVYLHSIKRRFGHAATDRQAAYLSADEITTLADSNPIENLAKLLAETGVMSYVEMAEMTERIWEQTKHAFNIAATEPKVSSRQALLDRVSVPRAPLPSHATFAPAIMTPTEIIPIGNDSDAVYYASTRSTDYALADRSRYNNPQTRNYESISRGNAGISNALGTPANKDVMRKHMTRVFDEILAEYPQSVYIGEDVEHGGYYLVTDGLASKYPSRVRDFPPDETSLLGVGVGMAQAGLLPVVEIPYAKYIDCGADMFFELALSSWLSETRQPNGMIIRLQGFGKGVFGGNFHTHNTIHTPPGVDVVCYSNGADYARGMRYAAVQAAHGRVVMSVDFTHLLNLRHVHVDDDSLRKPYTPTNEMIDFDTVCIYNSTTDAYMNNANTKKIAYVTYGEGLVTSLQARKALSDAGANVDITVVDCPLLSRTPTGLYDFFANNQYDGVVFVDPCKVGHTPLSQHCSDINDANSLPNRWSVVGAQATYNPLGSTITFVSVEDIQKATLKML